jgi:MFS family permease
VAADFGIGVGVAAWSISLYVLMLAVTTAVHGRISDLVGIRLPLLVGIGMMTGGALVAAFAPSYGVLLVARMFQGAGAAAIPTLGVALLSARYHGEVRALALGRLAGLAAAVSCFGPLVGGVVANEWGWRAVMALPILGVCVLPFLWRTLTGGGTGARLDVLGAMLVASTASGVVLLLQSPTTGRLVAGAGLLLVIVGVPLVTMWVRRRPDGFLPLEVIGNHTVVRSAVAAAAVPAAWFAQLVGIPVVLVGQGWEPWQVGTLLLPSAAFALLVPRHVGPLHSRFGAARCLALSGLIAAASLVLAAVGTAMPAPWALVLAVILSTVSFGIGQPSLSASVGDAVTHDVRGVALGIATLLFLVGGSIGSAAVAGLGDLVGVPGSLGLLAIFPLVGLAVLAPELRRVPEAVSASR